MRPLKNKINSLKNLSRTGKTLLLLFLGSLSVSIYLLNMNVYLQKSNRLLKTSLGIKPTPSPEPLFARFSPTFEITSTAGGNHVTVSRDWFKFTVPPRFSYTNTGCGQDCVAIGTFTDNDTVLLETHGIADSFSVSILASNLTFDEYMENKKKELASLYDSDYTTQDQTADREEYETIVGNRTAKVLGKGYSFTGYKYLYLKLPNKPHNRTYILQISYYDVDPQTDDYPGGLLSSFEF